MPLKVITTEDGSQSLYDDVLNETYHSTKGARAESQYVFVDQLAISNAQLSILEVGFGTGLNALLTWEWAEKNDQSIHFYSLEPFPIAEEIWKTMTLIGNEKFSELHEADWDQSVKMSEYFVLEKRIIGLEKLDIKDRFDYVFFDAFAPSKQPEIWSIENLQRCHDALMPGGILTTYCAQGQFKRNLKALGFEVEVLPGALGKKEMVRAIKG